MSAQVTEAPDEACSNRSVAPSLAIVKTSKETMKAKNFYSTQNYTQLVYQRLVFLKRNMYVSQ